MNEEIFTFTPIEQGSNWVSWGFGLIAVLGVVVLLTILNTKRKRSHSEITSMPIIILVTLATLLAAGAFFYSIKSTENLESVRLSKNEISTPFGIVKTEDIKNIYFFPPPDKINPLQNSDSIAEIYLIIEDLNGKKHPLSSRTYDIEAIHNTWKTLQKQ
jgi:hypothetical protein